MRQNNSDRQYTFGDYLMAFSALVWVGVLVWATTYAICHAHYANAIIIGVVSSFIGILVNSMIDHDEARRARDRKNAARLHKMLFMMRTARLGRAARHS